MKILAKEKRSAPLSDDIIYKLDSLSKSDDLCSLFKLLGDDGYSLKRYVLNYVQDHSEFRPNFAGNDIMDLINILNNSNIIDIESIDVVMTYNGIEVYGTAYPESCIFKLSFQKKNNNLNFKKI